jgi:hypothetical protein
MMMSIELLGPCRRRQCHRPGDAGKTGGRKYVKLLVGMVVFCLPGCHSTLYRGAVVDTSVGVYNRQKQTDLVSYQEPFPATPLDAEDDTLKLVLAGLDLLWETVQPKLGERWPSVKKLSRDLRTVFSVPRQPLDFPEPPASVMPTTVPLPGPRQTFYRPRGLLGSIFRPQVNPRANLCPLGIRGNVCSGSLTPKLRGAAIRHR